VPDGVEVFEVYGSFFFGAATKFRDALRGMEGEYGEENIRQTLERFHAADREVYEKTMKEHAERIESLKLGRPPEPTRD